MPRGPAKKAPPWIKLLQVMIQNKTVKRADIGTLINYAFEYRYSSLILEIKLNGGVIKAHKNGRKVDSYELMNVSEMQKFLQSKNYSIKIEKLSDLNAEKTKVSEVMELAESV